MKKILLTLFAIIVFTQLNAQKINTWPPLVETPELYITSTLVVDNIDGWWSEWGHSVFGMVYQGVMHSFNAIGDGYLHRSKYQTHNPQDITRGKMYNDVFKVMMYADYPIYVLTDQSRQLSWNYLGTTFFKRAGTSVLMRFNTFDLAHNLMIGEAYNYVGNIALTDKFWQSVATDGPATWIIPRLVSFTFVIGLEFVIKPFDFRKNKLI